MELESFHGPKKYMDQLVCYELIYQYKRRMKSASIWLQNILHKNYREKLINTVTRLDIFFPSICEFETSLQLMKIIYILLSLTRKMLPTEHTTLFDRIKKSLNFKVIFMAFYW